MIEIELPKGFTNVTILPDNRLTANNNDIDDLDTTSFPLPDGNWNIVLIDQKRVVLLHDAEMHDTHDYGKK